MKNNRIGSVLALLLSVLLGGCTSCTQVAVHEETALLYGESLQTPTSKSSVTTTSAQSPVETAPITVRTTAPTPDSTAAPITVPTDIVTTQPSLPETKPDEPSEPADDEMVLLSVYLPEALLDIRYATTNNFTGLIIYEEAAPRLRYGTVKKLRSVCKKLEEKGYRLVIWDAWRPAEAQWKLWNICPDPTYVSDPNKGYSSHTKGGTVDISLVYLDGTPVEMPTDLDDFSPYADTDFSDVSSVAAANGTLLQTVMKECGFRPYHAEWWHFTDTHTYAVLESLPR